MKTFGLIGYPLSHSFSKKYFTEQFERENILDCKYELFPIEKIDLIAELISKHESLRGLNVTIPYKVSVLPFLNELEEAAAHIGAVNCISIQRSGSKIWLKGYNTDAFGFEHSLKPLLENHHHQALIFGDGGAAKAVKYVLEKLGISFLTVTRTPIPKSILYAAVTKEILGKYTLLINTTPLGMLPNIDSCPEIPYSFLTEKHLVYDLVYNPEITLFLEKAGAQGAKIKNGMEMLHLQADRSWYIWNGL